jgi:SrtB family sortase
MIYTELIAYKIGADAYNDVSENVGVVMDPTVDFTPVIKDETPTPTETPTVTPTPSVEPTVTSTPTPSPSPSPTPIIYEEKEVFSLDIDWSKLQDPIIGWIAIQDEDRVNYPIVQSFDNSYYLDHLYDGTYNKSGSIFTDYRNDGLDNRHVIIYGHNLKAGTMFTCIKNYQKQDYADAHRYIFIGTPTGETRVFYVYSCHITDACGEENFSAYKVSFGKDEWQEWVAQTQEKSLITSEIEIPEQCNIITLSTCTSRGIKTERLVVHAVEISNKIFVPVENPIE